MNLMRPMKNVRHSAAICILTSLLSFLTSAGYGQTLTDTGKTMREALENLSKSFVQVSTYCCTKTGMKENGYLNASEVASAIRFPRDKVTFSKNDDGTWTASIEMKYVMMPEVKVEHIRENTTSTTVEAPRMTGRGNRIETTRVTRTERERVEMNGRIVSATPGRKTVTTTERISDGRSSLVVTRTKSLGQDGKQITQKEGSLVPVGAVLAVILVLCML